ncbi:hypothetical protein CN918_25695 [Priestia megaterium]|nr:hypothetical protein CN918_25695 [Priestia megaterium]
MTWIVVVSIVIVSAIKILITCLPTPVVNKLLQKFEMHRKLESENTIVMINNKILEDDEKNQIIEYFNDSTFLKQQYIHPGNERYFLEPENAKEPYVIKTKIGKTNVQFHVFLYKDHVDVVKQYKKKMKAYSIFSRDFQSEI